MRNMLLMNSFMIEIILFTPLSCLEGRVVVANHALDVLQHRRRALHDLGGAGVHHVALALRGAVLALEVVEAFSLAAQTML